jgi:hypothetical protein
MSGRWDMEEFCLASGWAVIDAGNRVQVAEGAGKGLVKHSGDSCEARVNSRRSRVRQILIQDASGNLTELFEPLAAYHERSLRAAG